MTKRQTIIVLLTTGGYVICDTSVIWHLGRNFVCSSWKFSKMRKLKEITWGSWKRTEEKKNRRNDQDEKNWKWTVGENDMSNTGTELEKCYINDEQGCVLWKSVYWKWFLRNSRLMVISVEFYKMEIRLGIKKTLM